MAEDRELLQLFWLAWYAYLGRTFPVIGHQCDNERELIPLDERIHGEVDNDPRVSTKGREIGILKNPGFMIMLGTRCLKREKE